MRARSKSPVKKAPKKFFPKVELLEDRLPPGSMWINSETSGNMRLPLNGEPSAGPRETAWNLDLEGSSPFEPSDLTRPSFDSARVFLVKKSMAAAGDLPQNPIHSQSPDSGLAGEFLNLTASHGWTSNPGAASLSLPVPGAGYSPYGSPNDIINTMHGMEMINHGWGFSAATSAGGVPGVPGTAPVVPENRTELPTEIMAHALAAPVEVKSQAHSLPDGFIRPLDFSVETRTRQRGSDTGPSLLFATFVTSDQGSSNAAGNGVAVDPAGNSYIVGSIDGTGFLAVYDGSGFQQNFVSFQARDDASGDRYANTAANAVGLDPAGNVYIAGTANDVTTGGDSNAFLVKMTPQGTILFGRTVGGPMNDVGNGVAVDPAGEATLTGGIMTSSFETDLAIAKFTPDGSGILFANTYTFSGFNGSLGNGISLNSSSSIAYVAGSIHSADNDALVIGVDNLSGGVIAAGYIPNPGDDSANGVAVDGTGHILITGNLAGSAGTTMFAARLFPDLLTPDYLFAYAGTISGNGVATDPIGNAYIAGAAPDVLSGGVHASVISLNPGGTITDSGLLAGSGVDVATSISFDGEVAMVAGSTTSGDLPVTDGSILAGIRDGFLAVWNFLNQLAQRAFVTDVIPPQNSAEDNQDSEPSLAVTPDGRTVAITTFSHVDGRRFFPPGRTVWATPAPDDVAPVFVSVNGGQDFVAQPRVPYPDAAGQVLAGPADQTIAYNFNGGLLYGAFLGLNPAPPLTTLQATAYLGSTNNIVNTDFGLQAPAGFQITSQGGGTYQVPDQPWLHVGRFNNRDRVYTAFNDVSYRDTPPLLGGFGRTASVYVREIGGGAPVYQRIDDGGAVINGVDRRTIRMDSPAVRVVSMVTNDTPPQHKVYAVFQRYTQDPMAGGNSVSGDVVVVRDDNGAIAANGFRDLTTPLGGGNNMIGAIVNQGNNPANLPNLFQLGGNQRIRSSIALAIDPSDATGNTLYVAYTVMNGNIPEIHLDKSTRGGAPASWAPARNVIRNAALPTLAVTNSGTVGLLYTRVIPRGANPPFMSTEFIQQTRRGFTRPPTVLDRWISGTPASQGQPYVGDYYQLLAIGNQFYGAYSGSNDPALSIWASNQLVVRYQRQVVGGALGQPNARLGDGAGGNANPSIDPFFFTILARN